MNRARRDSPSEPSVGSGSDAITCENQTCGKRQPAEGRNSLCSPFFRARRQSDTSEAFLMQVGTETFNLLLRFRDGATECYQIAYATGIEVVRIDNGWQYRGYISRQVCIYNRAGDCFTEQLADRRTQVANPEAGGIANEYQQWRHWPCEQDPPDTDVASDAPWVIIRNMSPAFALAVIADKRRLVRQFEQRYPGASISEID